MATSKVEFEGSDGLLSARLDSPDGDVRAYALFAHCFTCNKDILAARSIARGLIARGIATLRFDFTGLGHSEGEWANSNFSSNIEDLKRAAGHLADHYEAPKLLVGHSLGGAAVLAAARDLASVTAVATLCAPADPEHVSHFLEPVRDALAAKGEAEVTLAGRTFTVKQQFIDDLKEQGVQPERIASMRKALLVLHAPLDKTVGIENAAQIFQAARHPKSFISLDGADHLLTRKEDADYAASVLGAWVERYL